MKYPRCEQCPVKGSCVVERRGHTRYCEWIAEAKPGAVERISDLSDQATRVEAGLGPSLRTRRRNFWSAFMRIAGAAWNRKQILAAKSEQNRRLAICERCDRWTGTTCRECGCFGRLKARLVGEHCPLDPPNW